MADPITLVVLAGGFAAFLAKRSQSDDPDDEGEATAEEQAVSATTTTSGANIDDGVYPLPTLGKRAAEQTDGYKAIETAEHRQHLGVDLMYRRLPTEPASLPQGTKNYYLPSNTPVYAVMPGKIWSAKLTGYGHSVLIDHGNVAGLGPACTFYQHMASFSRSWQKGDVVNAGDQLGIVGGSLTGYPLHHLHFEIWAPTREKTIDPAKYLGRWTRKVILYP